MSQLPTKTPWKERLRSIYELVEEMSLQTDPQEMVRAYGRRMRELFPFNKQISLSRRELKPPWFRITRFSEWTDEINPWLQREKLPLLSGGLFAELLYGDQPKIIDQIQIDKSDPAYPYLKGQGSLMAIPLLDQGQALNMVILAREQEAAFDRESFPENFWMTNLFGRATGSLVLKKEVRDAYELLDRELRIVADIQRSLLPPGTPDIHSLELASYYRTSHRAGGDYFDFLPLSNGRWGLLIADVSGHGAPAAVVMAITHTIAHLYPGQIERPSQLLEFMNNHLTKTYTRGFESFVTCFFAVYDPVTKQIEYACAGHNPPLLKRSTSNVLYELDRAGGLPLGIDRNTRYADAQFQLVSDDYMVLFTDGITEAQNNAKDYFGTSRLNKILEAGGSTSPESTIQEIVRSLAEFTADDVPSDDRTLVVGRIR